MLSKFRKSEEGFTLIELLIVVAIIGILAAIAIPQFSAYRQRAYNSAAQSDVKNARVAQESLFSDYQRYGSSVPGTTLVLAQGVAAALGTEIDGAVILAAGNLNTLATTTAGQAIAIAVSNNVLFRADTGAASSNALLVSEHRLGDRAFAMDTDSTILYYAANPAWIGVPATGTATLNPTVTAPASLTSGDNLSAVAAGGVAPAASWTSL
jgi:prepilin-type N-terminal cleavage/methylation domain-containing protein